MKLVAITGSIGCGKTTIAKIVNKLGFSVYDVDGWVRRLYNKKDFIEVIMKNFPQSVENGKFNKRKLRKVVFNDKKELKKLEDLVHPFLDKTLKYYINKHSKTNYTYFIDVALLFEMGWEKYCDFIIVADVDYEIQKQRVMKRDNVSVEHFEQIVAVQLDNKTKKELADVVIDTNTTSNLLKLEIINIINGLEYNG
ncbi:MAG: dephospho-CoA kinase [Alphaproteobacteria bacterium]|nr:dephospho-CoA kinase [Alphaproteobacteria bacterium]